MKKSAFQFQDPYLTNLSYSENPEFNPDEFKGINIQTEPTVKRNENSNTALVSLNVLIGNTTDAPFSLSICMSAVFKWEEIEDPETVNSLLNKNAPSLLISYIRPIVSNITSSSRFPTLNIPFIDFRDAPAEGDHAESK